MWLMELIFVLTILLFISFSLQINQSILPTIKFKHQVMLLHSHIAQNRLYNRYGSKYFACHDKNHWNFYKVTTTKEGFPYITYTTKPLPPNYQLNLRTYREPHRLTYTEDYNTGSISLAYTGKLPRPLSARITVNRVGALRLDYKGWEKHD